MDGERLGEYAIDAELGSDATGEGVSAAGPDGVVALKGVHPDLLETASFLERFRCEAELGLAIRHRHVVRAVACGLQPVEPVEPGGTGSVTRAGLA